MKTTVALITILFSVHVFAAPFSAPVRNYEYLSKTIPSKVETACWTSAAECEKVCRNALFYFPQSGVDVVDACKYQTDAQLSFVSVGDDGSTLTTEILATNPLFTKLLASRRNELRLRTTWALASCDNVDMRKVATDSRDIEGAISQWRAYDFTQYMSCSYKVVAPDWSRESGTSTSETSEGLATYSDRLSTLTMLDNDDIQIESVERAYFIRKTAVVASAESAASHAAENFASIVKGYGALLVDMKDAPTPDRKASLIAYLAENKSALLADLATLDANLPNCGTMAKFNVNYTIKRGFAFVRTLEAKILGSFPMMDALGQ